MATDSLDDRRKALEEQFFQKHEKELVQKLKDAAAKEASRDELQHLTGINDPAVLDTLASLKLGGAATLVMSVYPVVEVAWADGELDGRRDGTVTASEAEAYVTRMLRRAGSNTQTPIYVGPADLVLSTNVTEVGPAQ